MDAEIPYLLPRVTLQHSINRAAKIKTGGIRHQPKRTEFNPPHKPSPNSSAKNLLCRTSNLTREEERDKEEEATRQHGRGARRPKRKQEIRLSHRARERKRRASFHLKGKQPPKAPPCLPAHLPLKPPVVGGATGQINRRPGEAEALWEGGKEWKKWKGGEKKWQGVVK